MNFEQAFEAGGGLGGGGDGGIAVHLVLDLRELLREVVEILLDRFDVPLELVVIALDAVPLEGGLVIVVEDLRELDERQQAVAQAVDARPEEGLDARTRLLGLEPTSPPTSFTIGIDTVEGTADKVRRAVGYRVLKVKVRADGIYGSGTTRLVKRFQKSVGLKQTGAIDRTTWIALLTASAQR